MAFRRRNCKLAVKQSLPASTLHFKKARWENKFKTTVRRLKREMEEIGVEQKLIGEEQMKMRERIEQVTEKCSEIRRESEEISKQQASNQVLLHLMIRILRCRANGDFAEAAALTSHLRDVTAQRRRN